MLVLRLCYIVLFILPKSNGYEKTLRKIVRNQSKMVPKPYSEDTSDWTNSSLPILSSSHLHMKSIHKSVPKMISSENGRSNLANADLVHKERSSRNIFGEVASSVPGSEQQYNLNSGMSIDAAVQNMIYEIPPSNFFPPVDINAIKGAVPGKGDGGMEHSINVPDNPTNHSFFEQAIYIPNNELQVSDAKLEKLKPPISENEIIHEQADFLIEEHVPMADPLLYIYNASEIPHTCTLLQEVKCDIDAQDMFAKFDIEDSFGFEPVTKTLLWNKEKKNVTGLFATPPWMQKKKYWNSIFDGRYENLMRNPKWPPLKVFLIPRTHVDTIWKTTFNQYHVNYVHKILSNLVKKLNFYGNLTFNWNEVSHLSAWWKNTNQQSRAGFRKLIKKGRIEITTGGWVETDEATTHLFGAVHLLVEGHRWLKHHLNYSPKVAWLTNSVSHSPTMTYLLSALGMRNLVMTNLHYSWEQYLSEYQHSDFIWEQSWDTDKYGTSSLNEVLKKIGKDKVPKHSVLTHYLQFNSAGLGACGPNKTICFEAFDFAQTDKNMDINEYNVKQKAEMLLEQYSKTGTITPHNVIIAPIGGKYRYETQTEFDYQYNNYQKIADFVNLNKEIYKATIEFGTPSDYFNTITEKYKAYPTLKGDFLNFAELSSGSPAYWTGFYTSRPLFKILLRRLQSNLRTAEILFSFAVSYKVIKQVTITDLFEIILRARESTARLMDRNVVSSTLPLNTLRYAHKLIVDTVKDCWYIQEIAASCLSSKPNQNKPHFQKYVYRDGEFVSDFRTVFSGEQIYIFNSLSNERTEIVELITQNPNVRVIDHNNKEIIAQINPVWKYDAGNIIKISDTYFKIIFVVNIPPLTFELYKIQDTYEAAQNAASFYCSKTKCTVDVTQNTAKFLFAIQPIETGDIQLENYKFRLIFDEGTGFLKTVVHKSTNTEKNIVIDFVAFRSSDINSGVFLFNTNVSKPLLDILAAYRMGIKSKIVVITSGHITTEITIIYGRLLQHTIRIYNLRNSPLSHAFYVKNKVDYDMSPKNRELELFMIIQTDIANGNPPKIFTDNNGFQYTARVLNISRRVESNVYPITTMAYIQDEHSRLTFITDHAQGVTALQEGQIAIMLDRRILFNDGRGTNEGLADTYDTIHRSYILLENFIDVQTVETQRALQLPSLSAVYLSNTLDFLLDIFIINFNQTYFMHYACLPLVRTSFPCDVQLINFRTVINRASWQTQSPQAALMFLHRRSFSCGLSHENGVHCGGETNFSLDKILRNVRQVRQTNFAGTNKGIHISALTLDNFPNMEITTLRVYF